MALDSSQSQRKISTRNISWVVKAAGAQGQQLPLSCADFHEIWSLNLLEHSRPVLAVSLLYTALDNLAFILEIHNISLHQHWSFQPLPVHLYKRMSQLIDVLKKKHHAMKF
jgi:hypothetical protein